MCMLSKKYALARSGESYIYKESRKSASLNVSDHGAVKGGDNWQRLDADTKRRGEQLLRN